MTGAVLPPLLGIGLILTVSSAARASSEKGFTSPPAPGSPFPPTPRCPRHYLTRLSESSPPAGLSSWLSACCHQLTALRGHGWACSSRQPHGHGTWPTRAPGVDGGARRAAASWGLRVTCSSSSGLLQPKRDAVCTRSRDPRLLLSGSGVRRPSLRACCCGRNPGPAVGPSQEYSVPPVSLACGARLPAESPAATRPAVGVVVRPPRRGQAASLRLLPSDGLARHRGLDEGGGRPWCAGT